MRATYDAFAWWLGFRGVPRGYLGMAAGQESWVLCWVGGGGGMRVEGDESAGRFGDVLIDCWWVGGWICLLVMGEA